MGSEKAILRLCKGYLRTFIHTYIRSQGVLFALSCPLHYLSHTSKSSALHELHSDTAIHSNRRTFTLQHTSAAFLNFCNTKMQLFMAV